MSTHRWCEHGYNVAFSKSIKELGTQFKVAASDKIPVTETVAETIDVIETQETKVIEPEQTKVIEPELLEEAPKEDEESVTTTEEKTRKILGM